MPRQWMGMRSYVKELLEANLKSVCQYFDMNWHPIREQRVDELKNDNIGFQNCTNN